MKNRHKEIIAVLKQRPFMKIEDLCRELDVSPATVRRDLSFLEESGEILRINGGAIYKEQAREERTDRQKSVDPYFAEKSRIAEAAVKLVKEGDTIFIDAGSTNRIIADHLLATRSNITVITNSIEIAYKLNNRKEISVIICGGTLGEADPDSIVGPVAEKMIAMFRANIGFVGTPGLDIRQGITDTNLSTARIKENMIEHSNKVFLVTDHSKFGVINTAFICPIEKIGHLITGQQAPAEDIAYLRRKGIEVTLV